MSIKDFFSKDKHGGKGFAAAVCVCLLIVAGAGVYSYSKISDRLNDKLIAGNASTSDEKDDGAPASAEQTNIAKTQTKAPEETTVTAGTEATEKKVTEPSKDADISAEDIPVELPASAQAVVRPLNGEVLNEFSGGELVKSSTLNVWKTHDGVDIAGNLNEKVKSMTGGTVSSVYEDQLMGVVVVIDHGSGMEGYYCNLSADVPVIEGQAVSAGTIVGTVGDTADGEIKEASHLHFGLKKNGEWIDPVALISGEGS